MDSCGFESYELECRRCGASLGGIIDPYDDELLLSLRSALTRATRLRRN